MASIVEMISHYQRSIDKSQDNPTRLLHCVEKLAKLPVTVEHLTVTKIGVTINDLRRKHEGEVNYAARALVTKWKAMVAKDEEEQEETASPEQNDNNVAGDDDDDVDEKDDDGDDDDNTDGKLEIDFNKEEEEEAPPKASSPPAEKSSHHKHSRSKSRHKDRHREKSDRSSSHKSSHHKKDEHRHHKSEKKSDRKDSEKKDHKREKEKKEDSKPKDKVKKEEKKSKRSSDEEKSSTKRSSEEEKSSSSKKRSSDEEKSSKKRKREPEHEVEIDSSMGASFADALGFLDKPSSSKKKLKTTKPLPKQQQPPTTSSNKEPKTPVLLIKKPKLEPLLDIAADIAPLAPSISTNYRPMPLNQAVMDCVFKEPPKQKQMTDDEAFAYIIQSKKERTRMFSGQKSASKGIVSSLYDMCLHVVQDNIDALEYTGGIPFDILRTILEKVSFEQLLRLEDFNPYLIEDTDYIWEQHSRRQFRGKQPEELESWREMFLRFKDEQAIKLRALTKNIALRNKQKVPEKTTKLAYVDSYVKPPRGIQNKQIKYGTDRLATASPAARVQTLSGVAANIAKVGDTRLKVAAAIRDSVPTHTPKVNPNRKAPLMQKTIMSMKKCFKR